MTGRLIFLTMTALPESEAATSFDLNALLSNRRRIASATAVPSMIAPSTMLSGGMGSMPNAATLKPLPTAFNSTAFTALDPMSSPTTPLDLFKPNTVCAPWNWKREHSRKADTTSTTSPTVRNWRRTCGTAIDARLFLPSPLTFLSVDHGSRQTPDNSLPVTLIGRTGAAHQATRPDL